MFLQATFFLSSLLFFEPTLAFAPINNNRQTTTNTPSSSAIHVTSLNNVWFPTQKEANGSSSSSPSFLSTEQLKAQILQLGASLDRGQAYNPTSGAYYSGTMLAAKKKVEELISKGDKFMNIPRSLEDMDGEWELVLSSVPHGIFRSSPFFLAVQEAFQFADDKG